MQTSNARTDFQQLKGETVLVTGARGFIGAHLCRRLAESGAIVYGTSRSARVDEMPHVRWISSGLDDAPRLASVLRPVRPDVIFHLASPIAADPSLSMVLPTFQGSLAATVNLLTAAAEVGCRRIVLSGSDEEPDNDAFVVANPYGAAKSACRIYAQMFFKLYATPVTLARIFPTYGPGQKDVRKLIPYVILASLRGETPKLRGGARKMDTIYVDDLVDGLLLMASVPGVEGKTIDFGFGTTVTVRRIVERIVEIVGSRVTPKFGALPDRPFETETKADLARTFAEIGWAPKVSLEDGLKSTVEWYRAEVEAAKVRPASH